MRPLLLIVLLLVIGAAIAVPATYFFTLSKLPRLESELDVEKLLRFDIESERMSIKMGQAAPEEKDITFARPDLTTLPKDLVALYLTQRGCPTYFQTPREEGLPWAKRMLLGLFGKEPGGDGWCERLFAWRIAERIGAKTTLELTIAAHKIHSFLQKDQLVAYDLTTIWFDDGVIGVDAAAKKLVGKPLSALDLAELSEMTLALPPHNYYPHVRDCQNELLIKQNRDVMIRDLLRFGLIPEDKAREAQSRPVACARR